MVTLTVTDESNNVSTATATVTVVDNIAPTAIAQNVTIALDATVILQLLPQPSTMVLMTTVRSVL